MNNLNLEYLRCMDVDISEISEGLYLGSYSGVLREEELRKLKITHVLSILDDDRKISKDFERMIVFIEDLCNSDIKQYFRSCINFIVEARKNGGKVFVHCLAGISRSATVVISYLMTATEMGPADIVKAIRVVRPCISPNSGFLQQLLKFIPEARELRKELISKCPNTKDIMNRDRKRMENLLNNCRKCTDLICSDDL